MPLSDSHRSSLLEVARQSVRIAATEKRRHQPVPIPGLHEPRAVFVTLYMRESLRGCIGSVVARYPLYRAVAEAAYSAAVEDPRFPPVQIEEVPELRIDISVLSPFRDITPEQIVVGEHGLLVSRGRQRGLLLPQVAVEHRLSALRFLEETCRKAGLPPDAWKHGASIQAFTAEVFGEPARTDTPSLAV